MPNRLASEKSPYLLQHANNPVDWYPWNEEAFQKARDEDKPIFLSIGYSTCHWCHVMERESFESNEIAEILNQYFVPVKVDREERPDIDRIYMTYVQAVTQSGGWPMSVWLTPDLRPFYGGTYFPPDSRYGRPGFHDLLRFIARSWRDDREGIVRSGNNAVNQLAEYSAMKATQHTIDDAAFERLFAQFRGTYDPRNGGFGGAPKFPRPVTHNFLFRYGKLFEQPEAARMVLHALKAMSQGGIRDHIGGGFHRYAVDSHWFVPHFEKMLYDQAQLVTSYIEALQITGDAEFARIAKDTLSYVSRDLSHESGAFYSAEDADSIIDPADPHHKGEGAFYVWSWQEVEEVLGAEDSLIAALYFGIEPDGNVEEDPHQEFTAKNILFEAVTLDFAAEKFGLDRDTLLKKLGEIRCKLFGRRATRPRPHLDDKILTSWNGLMISAYAKAAQVLDSIYADQANRAADFVIANMYDAGNNVLLRRYRDGEAAIPGFLDDYATFATALLDLYETSFDPQRLLLAERLTDAMIDRFFDRENGGFFSTTGDASDLVLRLKDDYDGAEPSGNSVACLLLLRLGHLLDRLDFIEKAEATLRVFSARLTAPQAVAIPQMAVAAMLHSRPLRQVVIAGDSDHTLTRDMLATVRAQFLPDTLVLLLAPGTRPLLDDRLAAIRAMQAHNGVPTAYVCQNFTCQLPVQSVPELDRLLHSA